MRLSIFTFLFAFLVASVFAVAPPQKPVIVSYPEGTPNSVLEEAKHAIQKAGGIITHEYRLIKAFAAKASEECLENIKTMGAKYNALIEEDKQVHADDAF